MRRERAIERRARLGVAPRRQIEHAQLQIVLERSRLQRAGAFEAGDGGLGLPRIHRLLPCPRFQRREGLDGGQSIRALRDDLLEEWDRARPLLRPRVMEREVGADVLRLRRDRGGPLEGVERLPLVAQR
jgi:hypothetical protein